MKIIDRQGRLFGKLSLIDLLVIAVVVILAAALYLKRNVTEYTSPTSPTTSIVYEVKIPSVREEMLDCWQVGDKVYDTDNDSGSAIGTITEVRLEPYQNSTTLTDGTYATYTIEGRRDVYLTLSADGLVSNGRYYVNRTYEINVNSYRNAYTKYADFECIITEIQQ
jgi:hypothetical protein